MTLASTSHLASGGVYKGSVDWQFVQVTFRRNLLLEGKLLLEGRLLLEESYFRRKVTLEGRLHLEGRLL